VSSGNAVRPANAVKPGYATRAWTAIALLVSLCAAACSGAEEMSERQCPPGNTTLGYEDFGKPFFAAYCDRCHGGTNAYSSHAFNTLQAIQEQRERIYINAAGPNETMPPGPDGPPEAERELLAEWLTCGAPE
jgi:uncharacterized membrane protein